MMKKGIVLLFGMIALFITSCEKVVGSGPLRTETRSTSHFSAIDVHFSGNVYYKQDNTYKVEVTAQQNILNVLETNIVNGRLVIKYRDGVWVPSHRDVMVQVSAPSVNDVSLSGSGNINVTGPLNVDDILLQVKSSGNINAQSIVANTIQAQVSGSGTISIANGATDSETLKVSGSGYIDVSKVSAKTATTYTSGSGTTKVNASHRLNVTISGSGSVYYKGNPVVDAAISGSGRVHRL